MAILEMTENVRQTNRERLREITGSIEKGIKELFESDRYRKYLTTVSRFPKYSVNNQMLIYMQMPEATRVAGYSIWHDRFGRNVIEGQRGIRIIAPVPYKRKVERDRIDPETKLPLMDADGNILKEEKEISVPMFRPVTVFDVSQTEGRPLPRLAQELQGSVRNFDVFMEALRRSSPVPVISEPMPGQADGYFDRNSGIIHIREGMSETATVSATLHEIAHSKLHNYVKNELLDSGDLFEKVEVCGRNGLFTNRRIDRDRLPEGLCCYEIRGTDRDPGSLRYLENTVIANHSGSVITAEPVEVPENGRLDIRGRIGFGGGTTTLKLFYEEAYPDRAVRDRSTREVEAESVSYAVCAYYGIATGENSFGYIAGWSRDRDLKELKSSLETINRASGELIGDIDRNYAAVIKERGMDKTGADMDAPEKSAGRGTGPAEAAESPVAVPDPKIGVKDMSIFGYTSPGMLPLSKDRALELSGKNVPVYLLYSDNTEAMASGLAEIADHDGLFGVARDDWDAVKKDIPDRDIEKRFDEGSGDALVIYQLKETASPELRFISYSSLKDAPVRDDYEPVYTQPYSDSGPRGEVLENIFDRFNVDRPADYCAHNLSVSDIVALRRGGEVTYNYCDTVGFRQLETFRSPDIPGRTEKAPDHGNGREDGIMNRGPDETGPGTERDKKTSVKEMMRQPVPKKPAKKTAKTKNSEMEI